MRNFEVAFALIPSFSVLVDAINTRQAFYPVKLDIKVKLTNYNYSAKDSGRLNFYLNRREW